ncbi:MAG: monooxygenase, partial [Pseudomonas sp.]
YTCGPHQGAPLLNIRLGEEQFLFDRLGASFYLLYFTDAHAVPGDIQAQVQALREQGVPLQVLAVTGNRQGAISGADEVIDDHSGHLRSKYGANAGSAYLVRPDQHVCARWQHLSGQALRAAIVTALGNE